MTDDEFFIIVTDKNIKVQFNDNTNIDWALDYVKSGEDPPCSVKIVVWNHSKKIAQYERNFQPYPNQRHYLNFVHKFLRDPQYRIQYQVSGQWTGTITAAQHGYQIHPVAQSGIQRLNRLKGKIKFKEFAKLKTGGFDEFSRLSLAKLTLIIPALVIEEVQHEAQQWHWTKQDNISCLRWIARGLKPMLAKRKVNVDREIKKNAEASGNRF